MANKLYVFGIGGTGSRVIKSLTMLLAAGVKLEKGFDTIVPIIIDPDTANGDLNRTAHLLSRYQNIFSEVGDDNNLFGTKIRTLIQLMDENSANVSDNFKFQIVGSSQKFGESIGYNGLDKNDNQALIDLLFSKENIESDMTVGFKGNPNIGSIVLNNFINTNEYRAFTQSFNKGDAIFIISSIFGGTGASGFPLLLKNLRNNTSEIPGSDVISKSVIGAISYLPYFKIDNDGDVNNEIDSSTFFGKAKSALSYYEHAIFNTNSLNSFYYLGDHSNNNMVYAPGAAIQKNDAHFLELAGAMSIFDFIKNINNVNNGGSTLIKEFGVNEDGQSLKFNNLGAWSKELISSPLSKLALLKRFLDKSTQQLMASKGGFNKGDNGVKKGFYESDFFMTDFLPFLDSYEEWLIEMERNDVSFTPFHDNQDHDSLMDFVKGKDVSRGGVFKQNKSTADIIIKEADKIVKSGEYDIEGVESRFLKIMDSVLDKQVNKILN